MRPLRLALGLVVIALPLALGGAHPEVNAAFAAVASALLVVLTWRHRDARLTVNLPIITLAVALGLTLLQLVPLPMGLIATIAPATHSALTLGPGAPPAWAPLSLDPPATAHEVLKLVGYLAAALVGLQVFGKPGRRRELLVWVAASGAAVAVVGLLHALAGWTQPYGTFGPPRSFFVSSFVNPNHLAGFLGLCAFVALGLALSEHGVRRWYLAGAATLSAAGVFLSLSRGGIVCLVFAAMFFGLVVALSRALVRRGDGLSHRFVWINAVLALALGAAAYLSYAKIVHELWTLASDQAYAKADIWKAAPRILEEQGLIGLGRGAFTAAHPRYFDALPGTYTHLENEPLQALADWGLPGGGMVLLLVAASFLMLLRRAQRDPALLGVASGLLYLAAQNLADFGLEVSGVALAAALLLTIGVGSRASSEQHEPGMENDNSSERAPARARSRALLWGAAVALPVVAGLLVLPAVLHSLARDTRSLAAVLKSRTLSVEEREAQALALVARHPADYFMALLAAERALADVDGPPRAMRWLKRGMYLAPSSAGAHHLAGQVLLRFGRLDQALLEYRLACAASPRLSAGIVEEVWRRTGSEDAVAALASAGPEVKEAVANVLLRYGAATKVVELLTGVQSTSTAPPAIAAPMPIPDVRIGAGELTTFGIASVYVRALLDLGEAEKTLACAQQMTELWPSEALGYSLQAKAQEALGDADAAIAALGMGARQASQPQSLLAAQAELHLKRAEIDEARRVAQSLLERSGDPAMQARAHWLLGRACVLDDRRAMALRHWQWARDIDPHRPGYRIGIAQLYLQLGDLHAAEDELHKAERELGSAPAITAALARVAEAKASAEPAALRRLLLLHDGPP